jgi:hypothetical protein
VGKAYLAGFGNGNGFNRLVSTGSRDRLNCFQDVETLNHMSEDNLTDINKG